MPDQLIGIDGTTFILSDRAGDINGGVEGLFARDARYISKWQLRLAGKKPRLLTSHHVDSYSNMVFLSNGDVSELPANSISVLRRRVVGAGLEEEIEFTNHASQALDFEARLLVESDFLDLFEVKAREFAEPEDQVFAGEGAREVERRVLSGGAHVLVFGHRDGEYSGQVELDADPRPTSVDPLGLTWQINLAPHATKKVTLRVRLTIQGQTLEPTQHLEDFGSGWERASEKHRVLVPRLRSSWNKLYQTFSRAILDLNALLIDDPALMVSLPAAGLPWFMTVFGRDTLITSYQILPGGLALGWGALHTLAALQATEDEPSRDAQPGRIVHELRRGPVAINGHNFPYYGSIDAPMLFLILLGELHDWSGDDEQARVLRPAAEAVINWMEIDGDLDGDKLIEYQRRSPRGLESQSWKDSWDSMRFHDGTIAKSPVATCEVQGYAYDAYRRMAALARGPWNDHDLATRLDAKADALFAHFNDVFWSDDRGGYYYLALDGSKRPVDSITSNMGHLLWSGIVPPERAQQVARQLLGPALFSGWGIRTMSTDDRGFNPIGYHCGTVWPHDNSLAVMGLHRYGFHEEANRVWAAMMDAAQNFPDFRIPEAFAGFDRQVAPFPVEYPTASSPQAWAAAAPLLMLRAALGAKPDRAKQTITIDPHFPPWLHHLELSACLAFDHLFDIVVEEGVGVVTDTGPVPEDAPIARPSVARMPQD